MGSLGVMLYEYGPPMKIRRKWDVPSLFSQRMVQRRFSGLQMEVEAVIQIATVLRCIKSH